MTHTVKNTAAQGEVYVRRFEGKRPNGLVPVKPEGNHFVVAHSETGHHHVMEAGGVQLLEQTRDVPEGLRILHLIVDKPTTLDHLRPFHTHESLLFEPGEYEIRLAREYTPQGFRRVVD